MPNDSILLKRTRLLLRHRDRTITVAKIADDTGLKTRFIHSVIYETNGDYGVNSLTVLYEYMAGKKLEVV